jgi:hypothetical protein
VRVAVSSSLPESLGQEPPSEGLDADGKTFGGELLAGQRGTEVGVACPVGGEDTLAKCGLVTVVGGLATQPVDQSGIATGLELLLDASDLAGTEFEESGRLDLGAVAIEDRLYHLEDITLTLAHLHTVPVLYLDHLASPSA